MVESEQALANPEVKLNKQIFQVSNFSYQYPESNGFGLKDLSFAVNQGEVLGIVGESGSGKTTLLHSLSGFIPHFFREGQYSGEINFLGNLIAESDLLDLAVQQGVVFQDPSTQLFGLGVEDALAFGMENIGLPREEMEKRINQVLQDLEIDHLRKRQALTLSGGERQVVAIASMLAMKPKVILFDEVISALDPRGQKLIRDVLSSLKEQNISMILVDADFSWLSSVADRVLVLHQGQLAFDGEPNQVLANQRLASLAGAEAAKPIEFRQSRNSPIVAKAESVSFSYDDQLVVNNVSCEIKQSSCLGIIGHNGSGKTTLAKLLAGIYRPAKGEITVKGEEISGLKAEQAVQRVGYLYQLPATMFMHSTVLEEVNFSLDKLKIGKPVDLADFGLAGCEDASPYELSSGQQQRLALACLLSTDPEIIILDEPTLGQSQQDRQNLVRLIFQLQEQGKTIILISHDWPMVARAAEEILVMNQGHLVAQGPTGEVLQDRAFFDSLDLPLPW